MLHSSFRASRYVALTSLTALATLGVSQAQVWPMEGQDRYGTFRAVSGPEPAGFSTPWIYQKINTYGIISHGPAIDQKDLAYYNSWVSNLLIKSSSENFSPIGTFNYLNWGQSTPALSASGAAVFVHALRPYQFSGPSRLYRVSSTSMVEDWFFETGVDKINDYESASPKVGPDGDVMFGSRNGSVWRINKYTGRPVWTRNVQEVRRTIVFTRDDAAVIVASNQQIIAMRYSDGATLWTKSLGSVAGAPGVAPDGTVVVGSESGTIFGLNPATGATKWSKAALAKVIAAPAFSLTGEVYIGGYDNRIRAFKTSNGQALWAFTTTHECVAPPAVDIAGRILLMNRIGQLYCLAPDGTQLWTVNTTGGARGPMTIGEKSTIYIGTNITPADIMVIKYHGIDIQFTKLSMSAGALSGGGIGAVHKSDNVYASYRTGSYTANVEMNFEGSSATYKNLASFTMRFETNNTAGATVTQKVEVYNNSTSTWDVVDTRPATVGDTAIDVTVNTNTNNYVDQTTGLIKARLHWTGGSPGWSGKVDQARMTSVVPAFVP